MRESTECPTLRVGRKSSFPAPRGAGTSTVRRERAAAFLLLSAALCLSSTASASDVPFSTEHTVDGAFLGATSVVAADMDGDGDLDVLGAARDDDDVTWWENTAGDASAWTVHVVDGNFNGAASVAAADVDGDGDLDVLGAARDANAIVWWENTAGDGSAWTEHSINAFFAQALSVFPADVDGDGDVDVLGAAYFNDDITWFENASGDGSLWWERNVENVFSNASSISAADVDSDGDLDILGAAQGANHVTWWENTAGNASYWMQRTIDNAFGGARWVRAADVDGDGDLDVLGAAKTDADITWWENTAGNGSNWSEHTIDDNFSQAYAVFAADVDGDGDVDVLGAANGDNDVTWWENTAGDGSAWTEHTVDGAFAGAVSVDAADLDGDGDLDVLGAARTDGDVSWWENETIHRSAVHPVEHTVDGAFAGATSVYAADVDGDGDLDVLGAASTADDVTWWENTAGDASTWTEHTVDGTFNGAFSVYAADVDGDGDLDVLGVAETADAITWWENTSGDGSTWSEHLVNNTFDDPKSVHAADVDGDGDVDLLGAALAENAIRWWENTSGDGSTWSEHPVDNGFAGAHSVYAADVDGDGDVDVLGAAYVADEITWWENTSGDGSTWTEHTIRGFFLRAQSVYAADVDGDGDVDVLGAANENDDVTWWENTTGDGSTWTEHTLDGAFNGASSVYAADVDGDGDVDVLGTASVAGDVTWWENRPGDAVSTWPAHTVDAAFGGAHSVVAADVDGDGDVDVLGAARNADDITWWENRGGQFALATTDTAPATAAPGSEDDLLRIVMTHRGRSGDHDEELVTLDLLLEETAGDPLSTAEANSLIANLKVYRDDGSGVFEIGSDTLVTTVSSLSLTAGVETVSFVDGDVNVQVAFGTPVTFFVALEFESLPMTTVGSVRLTHLTESTSTAEDRVADVPLVLEYVGDVTASLVSVPHADLAVSKSDGVTSATPGGSLTYTILVTNNGPGNDPSAKLTDTFPAALTCDYTSVAAGGASGNTAAGAGDLSETLSLPAGSSVTYTVDCTIDCTASGTLSNTAVIASETDPTPADNSATDDDTLLLQPLADLSVTKDDQVTEVSPGGSVTYTIVAANAGPCDAPSVSLVDLLEGAPFASCSYTSVADVGVSGNTPMGSGSLDETLVLPAGTSVTYTVPCTLDGTDPGVLSNTATISSSAVTDPDPDGDSARDQSCYVCPGLALKGRGTVSGTTRRREEGGTKVGEEPVEGVTVALYDMAGTRSGEDVTDAAGAFTVEVPGEGCYFLATDAFPDLLRQIWNDRTCEEGDPCDPTTGDLLRACDDESLAADFLLDEPAFVFADGFESGGTTAWSATVPASVFADGFESGDTTSWSSTVP